jgi:hypothetical protein
MPWSCGFLQVFDGIDARAKRAARINPFLRMMWRRLAPFAKKGAAVL